MKNVLSLAFASLFTLALAASGMAADSKSGSGMESKGAAVESKGSGMESKGGGSTKAGSTKTQQVTGEVVSVDPKAGTLTVKATGGDKNFMAEEKAKGSLDKVKTGDKVKVTYVEKDGQLHARSVAPVKATTAAKSTKSERPGKSESKGSKPAIK